MQESVRFLDKLVLDNKYWIPRHLMFWVVMYLDLFFEAIGLLSPYDREMSYTIMSLILNVALVYINIYYLLPKFLLKRSYIPYALFTALSVAIVLIIENQVLFPVLAENCNQPVGDVACLDCYLDDYIGSFITTSGLLFTAVAFKTFKYNYQSRVKIEELSQMNLKADLEILQKQVNPHFLFNALNSIYVKAKQEKSNLVAEDIMQLSELMRYQTYDSQKEFVKLEDEVNYLKNFLYIERQRRDNMKVGFIIEGEMKDKYVSPLLFLPLIENAVKYSQRSDGAESYINVAFNSGEDAITITVINNKSNFDVNANKQHGFGLANLKKRLDILYPDHQINISDLKDKYFIELTIPNHKHKLGS